MRFLWLIPFLGWQVFSQAAEAPAPTSPAILGLMEKIQGLPDYEASRELGGFMYQAARLTDLAARLQTAEAGVWLARHHPEWMRQKLSGLEGSVQSSAIEGLFMLLSDSVEEEEEQIFIPPLHPALSRNDSNQNASPRDAPSLHYLKRRRELHAELCAISLQQPAWAEYVLSSLSAAWLADGAPTKEEMRAYLTKAMAACSQHLSNAQDFSSFLSTWIRFPFMGRFSEAQRVKMLELALPLGMEALKEGHLHSSRPLDFIVCIMNQARLHPGQPCSLMDEIWRQACAEQDSMARRAVFPYWAAYQFQLSDDISKCLHHAEEFTSDSRAPFFLRAVISACGPQGPWEIPPLQQQIRLAAFINAIVFQKPEILNDENTAGAVADTAAWLTKPRASAENLLMIKRAREAHVQLLEKLVGHAETSIDALFYLLRVKILNDTDTREIERQLIAMTPAKSADMEEPLKRFISDANGSFQKRDDKNNKPEGCLDGCWDLKHRNAWMAAALRIGRELNKHYHSIKSDSWVEAWLNAAMKANWLAIPPVPGGKGHDVARRPEGGFDPLQFPPAELLRARDDLIIEGHELALSLTPPRGDFSNYTALLLARTPPDTAPVMRRLQQDPAKLGSKLYDLLNTCPDKLESELSAAEIVEAFIKQWPDDATQTEWVKSIRSTLLGLSIPIIKGVWWSRNSSFKCDLDHNLPASQKRYATYLHLLHLAIQKPALETQVFQEYAQVHLSQEPDLVLTSFQRVLARDPRQFYYGLRSIFQESEARSPPARRLEWARLLLRLLPALQKQSSAAPPENQAACLESFSIFCHIITSEPKSPLWKELPVLHGQFMTSFTSSLEFSPQLLDVYAAAQFAKGAPWKSLLQQIKSSFEVEKSALSERVDLINRQIWNWCSRLRQRETTTEERLWSARILVGMIQFWPQDGNRAWMTDTSSMLVTTAKTDPTSLRTVLQLHAQLLSTAFISSYVLWDHGIILAQAGESLDEFEQRCLTMAQADPRKASKTLVFSLKRDQISIELKPGGMPLMQSALHVLQRWPDDAPVESYAWAHTLIDVMGDQRSFGMDAESVIGVKRKSPPPSPASGRECIAYQVAVLAELHRRQIPAPWMPALQMRLAWRSHADLHEFFSAHHRDATLAYLSEVLSFDLHNVSWQFYSDSIQSAKFFLPHRNAQEAMEAARILLVATDQKLVDTTTARPLLQQSSRCMQRIIELGQEVSKICARVPDGTWSGAIHPSQAREAAELKKLLESALE